MSSFKNIIVFGAHGKIGQHLIKLIAKNSSIQATAVVRNDEQAKAVSHSNVKTTNLTLDDASVSDLTTAIKGHDAIILTVGSAGKNLLQVDLDGVVKTFEASVAANVKRLVLVSAIHAEIREFGAKSGLRDYYISKHYADRILINEFGEKLQYTIIKPTHLTDDEPTGKIKVLKDLKEDIGKIPRADVAQVLLDVLNFEDTFGKSFNIASGNHAIDDAKTWT
ncbi:hypothetical protein PVL30_000052 [Lodderomyces elongisporus]|uniref:uncharacterized protein n=1 Tax=Lodderomyces elongisporus TaxID=36914 RepID=UPI00291FF19A|nr:uncharacterized protein PVL30_000052 [Lodderomyces elongisporus]WLF76351.1 hypothetical protein PVL30_000052 [Lodderomyces elongisporus]